MRSHYILRIDDICPTTNWEVWGAIEEILDEYHVKPLLAVVPDNQDPVLQVGKEDGGFWQRVRSWQSRGWSIGMHGWQHRFESSDAGLLGVNSYSEFAGLPVEEQRRKLTLGRDRFISEGLTADIWIAPAHSFDRGTLEVLRELDFRYISDGFFLFPCRDDLGMLWVPQQLWGFRKRPFGVWTVCLHINRWTPAEVQRFRNAIDQYRPFISDFREVAARFAHRRRSAYDTAGARMYRFSTVRISNLKAAVTKGWSESRRAAHA